MMDFAQSYWLLYIQGAVIGLFVAVIAMAGSVVLGLSIAIARLSDNWFLRWFGAVYVALFRGIPPLVMIYIVYFGLPTWARSLEFDWLAALLSPLDNRIIAAVVALAINSGAYSAEIIRASIIAVPTEQMETAKSIGMSYVLSMRRIILPQAFRVGFAPLGNEFITLLKGTSLVSVIGVSELMRTAQLVAATTLQNLTAYSFAAVIYVGLVIVIQGIVYLLERRMRVHVRPG
jgi:His/Glu/Gln/Arg/opine family amino acid ABC transporter permease subunit